MFKRQQKLIFQLKNSKSDFINKNFKQNFNFDKKIFSKSGKLEKGTKNKIEDRK